MKKKGLNNLAKEIAWLKRDKYHSQATEIRLGYSKSNFSRDLARLQVGEPSDYVIGWKEFLGCQIDLSYHPLIPREETEFWVGEVLRSRFSRTCSSKPWRNGEPEMRLRTPLRVLDLFSGSGCIGLAVLKHCPNVQMTFGEKDLKLCQQIKKNLQLNKIPARRAKILQTNLFKPYLSKSNFATLQKSGRLGKYDIIFANPPYIPAQKSRVQKSVEDWEPKEALYAGPDGLAIIKKFLRQAKDHLNSGGRIYLEFGYGQKTKIEKLIKQFNYFHSQFHRDQFGRWRLVVIE